MEEDTKQLLIIAITFVFFIGLTSSCLKHEMEINYRRRALQCEASS